MTGHPPTTSATRPRRARRLIAATTVGLAALVPLALPSVAGAQTDGGPTTTPPTSARCRPAVVAKGRAAAEIQRRQATIADLLASLHSAPDPYGVNGAQTDALHAAATGLTQLGQQIATTCYPDAAAFKADASRIFVDYRIYALRVPQTKAIEAADHLGGARGRLQQVADGLAAVVGTNTKAKAELDAMNQSLAAADATLGHPPTLQGAMAAVPGLQPAKDLDPIKSALTAARSDLQATRQDLAAARRHAMAVLAALGG